MNTTTKQAIREALNALNDAQLTSQPSANYGNLLSGAHKAERILQSALALLDKSGEGGVRGAGKALTDEEIEKMLDGLGVEKPKMNFSSGPMFWCRQTAEEALRCARDNGYLAPSKAPAEVVVAGSAMRDQFWRLFDELAKNGAGWFPTVDHVQRITTSIVNWDAALKSNTNEHVD